MVLISESPGEQGHMEDALSSKICFLFQPHVSLCLTSSFLLLQHWSASHSLLLSTYNHPPQPRPQLQGKNTQWFSFRKSFYHNHHPHLTPHATSTVCYISHLLDWNHLFYNLHTSPNQNVNSLKTSSLSYSSILVRDYIRVATVLSVQFSRSVVSDSLWPHGPQHTGFLVHYQLLELTQIHAHWVGDAIQPSHPLSSPSPPAFNLSQHQSLFKWVSSSHQVAKVLEFQLQHQSFQWIFRTDFLEDGLVGSPCSPRDSQESSLAPQFKSINSSVLSFLYSPTLTSVHDYWKNHSFDQTDIC